MIVRRPRYHRFTVLPDEALNDERLTWKARGLLAFLLSKPDHWRTTSAHLANVGPDGRDAVRAGLAELEDAGYLVRRKYRDERGRWKQDTYVYDNPEHHVDNPGDSDVDKSLTEAGLAGTGGSGPLVNTDHLILSEEDQRHSSVLSEVIPSLCPDCNGNGYVTSPLDPLDVERCARCNPHPRDRR